MSSWDEDRRGLEQRVSAATGTDPNNPLTRAVSETAGVGARYMDSVKGIGDPPQTSDGRGWKDMTGPEKAVAGLRKVQQTVGVAMGAMGVLQDMVDVGFANLTNPIAKALPAFPAATLGMLYVGIPHAHAHPPSLIPPAPPIPLPTLGPITLGTSVRVLINGTPAARSGDIGLAPTCGGFAPFFQVKTGSSNVFIGGCRAARMLDICIACGKGEGRKASKIAVAVAGIGMAADLGEAAVETNAALAAGKALAAAMAAAQMAADAVAIALSNAMGTDPCTPPVAGPPSYGAVTLGMPNVLIGGFPMPNLPDPAGPIINALKRLAAKLAKKFGVGKPP